MVRLCFNNDSLLSVTSSLDYCCFPGEPVFTSSLDYLVPSNTKEVKVLEVFFEINKPLVSCKLVSWLGMPHNGWTSNLNDTYHTQTRLPLIDIRYTIAADICQLFDSINRIIQTLIQSEYLYPITRLRYNYIVSLWPSIRPTELSHTRQCPTSSFLKHS